MNQQLHILLQNNYDYFKKIASGDAVSDAYKAQLSKEIGRKDLTKPVYNKVAYVKNFADRPIYGLSTADATDIMLTKLALDYMTSGREYSNPLMQDLGIEEDDIPWLKQHLDDAIANLGETDIPTELLNTPSVTMPEPVVTPITRSLSQYAYDDGSLKMFPIYDDTSGEECDNYFHDVQYSGWRDNPDLPLIEKYKTLKVLTDLANSLGRNYPIINLASGMVPFAPDVTGIIANIRIQADRARQVGQGLYGQYYDSLANSIEAAIDKDPSLKYVKDKSIELIYGYILPALKKLENNSLNYGILDVHSLLYRKLPGFEPNRAIVDSGYSTQPLLENPNTTTIQEVDPNLVEGTFSELD